MELWNTSSQEIMYSFYRHGFVSQIPSSQSSITDTSDEDVVHVDLSGR